MPALLTSTSMRPPSGLRNLIAAAERISQTAPRYRFIVATKHD
jgi:hypothetical protein